METFAEYILDEENLASKMEIAYYLAKKQKIFFDKTVIMKTEIIRLFLKWNRYGLDDNMILTASLLCNCKKVKNSTKKEDILTYAKKGAEFLESLGFDKRFCKICEEINRYSGSNPREKESDILELAEQFGGMILDRDDRIAYSPEDAVDLLVNRNLKNQYNRYMESFVDFVEMLEDMKIENEKEEKPISNLVRMLETTDKTVDFIKKVVNEYEPKIDKLLRKQYEAEKKEMFAEYEKAKNRPLFSEEITRKILKNIQNESSKNELEIKE